MQYILNNKDKFNNTEQSSGMKNPKCGFGRTSLYAWFKEVRSKQKRVNGNLLLVTAKRMATSLKAAGEDTNSELVNVSWLQRWRERHDIKSQILKEKEDESDVSESDDGSGEHLPSIILIFLHLDKTYQTVFHRLRMLGSLCPRLKQL